MGDLERMHLRGLIWVEAEAEEKLGREDEMILCYPMTRSCFCSTPCMLELPQRSESLAQHFIVFVGAGSVGLVWRPWLGQVMPACLERHRAEDTCLDLGNLEQT